MPSGQRFPTGTDELIHFGQKFTGIITRVLVTGFVIIVPFIVLVYLLNLALKIIRGILQPVIQVLEWAGVFQLTQIGVIGTTLVEIGFYDTVLGFYTELITILVLFGTIILVGVFASFRSGQRTVDLVDTTVSKIPGIGPVYQSLRRMGDVLLESGLDNFQSVKLVEFPHDDLYSLAFETNRSPESVTNATAKPDLVTLFIPFAPNPVMGGILVHVSRDKVYDIDMTVEEAARTLVTSGIAAGGTNSENHTRGFPPDT